MAKRGWKSVMLEEYHLYYSSIEAFKKRREDVRGSESTLEQCINI
jgi:hypothetical protein